ncbi:MAG: hypothetical protein LBF27_28660 [Sphingobacterium sp.]|jgi:hypothetical protein|nr:hypothetical protein [Sphingobacterium sp.]
MIFSQGNPSHTGFRYCFLSLTVNAPNLHLHYSLRKKPSVYPNLDEYHQKLDRILQLLASQQLPQMEIDNGLLRDAEYVKSYVGISTETLYRLQRDGYISVAKRDRNKRYYRDIDVEHLRNSYRGL